MATLFFICVLLLLTVIYFYLIFKYNIFPKGYLLRPSLFITLSILFTGIDLLIITHIDSFYQVVTTITFVFLIGNILMIPYNSISSRFLFKKRLIISEVILLSLLSIPILTKCFMKVAYLDEIILSIMQTNKEEAISYSSQLFDSIDVFDLLFYITIYFIVIYLYKQARNYFFKQKKTKKRVLSFESKYLHHPILLFLLFNSALLSLYATPYPVISGKFFLQSALNHTILFQKEIAETKSYLVNNFSDEISHVGIDSSLTIVVGMGESLSRDYMSCYNYPINTTPYLNKLKRENTIILKNSYASAANTSENVPYILTMNNQYNTINNFEKYNCIDILNIAGFETFWLSNQTKIGVFDSPITVLAEAADYSVFRSLTWNADKSYDEKLLPELKSVLERKVPKVIFLHFMGQHSNPKDQYPNTYPFLRDTIYENNLEYHYDNSLIYNDSLINEVVNLLEENCENFIFTYISDHGDKPGIPRLKNALSIEVFHIPFISYMSETYKERNPDIYKNIKENSNSFWSNDLFFEYLLGVTGLNSLSFYNSSYDITSSDYCLTEDNLKIGYNNHIKDHPYRK